MGKRRAHGEGGAYQRADGRWCGSIDLGYRADGKRNRRVVYAWTQREVLTKLADLRNHQASAGIDLTQRQTLRDFLKHWLGAKADSIKPRTHELYEGFVAKADKHLGHLDLTKVSALQVQTAIRKIAATSGASTANNVRRLLFGAFKQAVTWRLVTHNPVEGVAPLKETPRDVAMWTTEQAAIFLDSAMTHRLYALFYLFLSTGLRAGEATALRWSDVAEDHLVSCHACSVVLGWYFSPDVHCVRRMV